MNTDLDLTSSVEINFKSDYVPLNRLASNDQASRIRANTRNPEAEAAEKARADRATRADASDRERQSALDKAAHPHGRPAETGRGPARRDPRQAGRDPRQAGRPRCRRHTRARRRQAGRVSVPRTQEVGPAERSGPDSFRGINEIGVTHKEEVTSHAPNLGYPG